ncbi:hypothetical protein LY622_13935 [Halomonas sp. M5N1S17]|uniref:hypothetical protein n=1 Tax=Halomonas alkalisoli TaxID=2907158 RepID=UPI001F42B711|nr:hypothetical protein [Halomonas alkalisoli]MCE9664535.1 hypothetical protein [Halomonas alkalisoli]
MPYAANGQISQSPIEGGVPINDEQYQDALAGIMRGEVVSIDGGFSVAPPPEPEKESEPEPLTPEQELVQWRKSAFVSSRQGEQQLILAGLDEQVEAAIDGIEDVIERKLTRAWYNRSTVWERTNPQFVALGYALGLTDDQIDEHVRRASKL